MSKPIVFLDFDDVICTNKLYGGYDVLTSGPKPADLFEKLFHPPAVVVLLRAVDEFDARVVITTSWLRFMERPGFEALFRATGMTTVAERFHTSWEAPADRGMTRAAAIDRWLDAHHRGEAYVILDDENSGTGLPNSRHHHRGRLVLCQENVGLHEGHWPQIRAALDSPDETFPRVNPGRKKKR
ncbi:HAD domain-containing protein [Paucibacter soli]|uniref:HAD domain-containing protein n=1 Tax=Paucibacter soli TaxID=3133433 RepID=UPI00309EC016